MSRKNKKHRLSKRHEDISTDPRDTIFKSEDYEARIPQVFDSKTPSEDKPHHTKNTYGKRLRDITSHAFRLLDNSIPSTKINRIRSTPPTYTLRPLEHILSSPNHEMYGDPKPIKIYNIEHSDIGGFIHGLSNLLGQLHKSEGISKIEGKKPEEIKHSVSPSHDMYIDDPVEHEKFIKTLQKHISDTPEILKTYLSHRFSNPEFYNNELFKEDDDKSEKEDFRHFLMNHPDMKDKEHLNDYGYLLTGHY